MAPNGYDRATMTMDIETVDELNKIIRGGGIEEYIRLEEEAKLRQIKDIADEIAEKNHQLKWIWLAGPSSAGKITFTKRLAEELNRPGIPTHEIPRENYFHNTDLTPKNAKH